MGELVDEQQGRLARKGRVEIELLHDPAAVLDLARGQDLEAVEQRVGLAAAVGFDEADDHVDTGLALGARGLQHGVGLADAGAAPKKIFSFPRCSLRSSRWTRASSASGSGRLSLMAGYSGMRSSARLSFSTLTLGSPRNPSWRPSVAAATATHVRGVDLAGVRHAGRSGTRPPPG